VFTRSILTPLLVALPALAGCARTDASHGSADSLSSTPANAWIVTPTGIGAIRVGLDTTELRRIAGDFTAPKTTAECSYVRPTSAPPGVSIMLSRGRVARVDVDSVGVRSDAGIAVGDSASHVAAVYGVRVTATPHKYVSGGLYLSVRPAMPADSRFRIVFETDSGRVTRFRSGRLPEVAWVERCG
jgi:hypothetical protein